MEECGSEIKKHRERKKKSNLVIIRKNTDLLCQNGQ